MLMLAISRENYAVCVQSTTNEGIADKF